MALTRAQKTDLYKIESKIAGGNVSKVYYQHGVKYGDYFDLRIYKDVKITHKYAGCDKTKSKEGGKRDDSVARARVNLYRLITGNIRQHGRYRPIFGTYTFKDNITDVDEANLRLKLYLASLTEHLGYRPKYVAVPETQKRGAWHFHIVFFNVPKLNYATNDKLWGQGQQAVNLQFIRGVRDVGAYVSKYLSKEIIVNRGINKKMYYTSRGLLRPQDVFHKDTIDNILRDGTFKVLSTFEGNTYSQIKYKLL
jgi:hypothetical protein